MPIRVELYDRTADFDGGVVTIGRNASNDVVVERSSVSRFHCELRLEDGTLLCQDRSKSGTTLLDGEKQVRLARETWTPVPLDADGRGVLFLGDVAVRVVLLSAPADAPATPSEVAAPDAVAPVARVAAPAPKVPAPTTDPARGVGAAVPRLLQELIADGSLDPSEPVAASALVRRLCDLTEEVARALVALNARLEENERLGLTNGLGPLLGGRDAIALARALVSPKTGPSLATHLPQALEAVGRREKAVLAALTGGVRELLAELDPARDAEKRRGGLGSVFDKAMREYALFFREISGGLWREIVLGKPFVSRFEQALARRDEE